LLLHSITPRLTHATAPCIFTPPSISASDDSDDYDDDVPGPPPTPHASFDMHDTNASLTTRLTREIRNLETFYNPKPGDENNIALLTHGNHNDETLANPYKEPGADLEIISDDVEFCNAHLPEYDSNPQSAAQALLRKNPSNGGKLWLQSF
jgi:hypothetical protein